MQMWFICFVLKRRYDLRIRYVPVNFLEKFKDDRSTLLYFYQQVTSDRTFSYPVSGCSEIRIIVLTQNIEMLMYTSLTCIPNSTQYDRW